MRQVTFETTYSAETAHPFHRRLMASDDVSRAELLIWGPTAAVTTLTWFDAGRAATAAVLEAVDSATRTHLVEADAGTYAFVHQTDYEYGAAVLDAVAGARVVFLPPVRFDDAGAVRYDAVGESAALGEFYADIGDRFDTEILRVRDFQRWPAPAPLTDRQRAALSAAVDVGYYRVPRAGSVDDVAAELDCSRSTAGELLRRAESAVLTAFVRSER